MTNQQALDKATYSDLLSYSKQLGLITSLQLRKNQKIKESLKSELEQLQTIGKEKKLKPEAIEKSINDFLNQNFEGNLHMVGIHELGDLKYEEIPIKGGGFADAKELAIELIGTVIINTNEAE